MVLSAVRNSPSASSAIVSTFLLLTVATAEVGGEALPGEKDVGREAAPSAPPVTGVESPLPEFESPEGPSSPWSEAVFWISVSAGALVLLAVLWRICLWAVRRVRRSDASESGELDNYTIALRFLSERLDERSFGFLAKRLEVVSSNTMDLMDRRYKALKSAQKATTRSVQRELSRLLERMKRLDRTLATGESLLGSLTEKLIAGAKESSETLKRLERLTRSVEKVEKHLEERDVHERITARREHDTRIKALQADSASLRAALEKVTAERDAARSAEADVQLKLAEFVQHEEARRRDRESSQCRSGVAKTTGDADESEYGGSSTHLVAELRELHRKLRAIRGFQRALTDGNLPVATFAVNADFKVFVWNPAAETLLGRRKCETRGRVFSEIDVGSQELSREITSEARRALESVTSTATPRRNFVLHGQREVLRVHCEPIRGGENSARGVIVSVELCTPGAPVKSVQRRQKARV